MSGSVAKKPTPTPFKVYPPTREQMDSFLFIVADRPGEETGVTIAQLHVPPYGDIFENALLLAHGANLYPKVVAALEEYETALRQRKHGDVAANALAWAIRRALDDEEPYRGPAKEPTDDELRALWKGHGGMFFGPHVEHGSMPEHLLLPLLRRLMSGGVKL